jgi:hypothetical protein
MKRNIILLAFSIFSFGVISSQSDKKIESYLNKVFGYDFIFETNEEVTVKLEINNFHKKENGDYFIDSITESNSIMKPDIIEFGEYFSSESYEICFVDCHSFSYTLKYHTKDKQDKYFGKILNKMLSFYTKKEAIKLISFREEYDNSQVYFFKLNDNEDSPIFVLRKLNTENFDKRINIALIKPL